MSNIILPQSIFILLLLVFFSAISFILYQGKMLGWFKDQYHSPSKYPNQVECDEAMAYMLNLAPGLSLNEKIILIQRLFGRPIRIIIDSDDKKHWLSGCLPFEPTDGEQALEANELIKKSGMIG